LQPLENNQQLRRCQPLVLLIPFIFSAAQRYKDFI
jgi:hypothetical protein